ncbi:MAG: FAD-dependent oxidoreductase [Elusimicrobia bacterium]|nr:FAD-dependent oxidoreductase [Elusimicrobiota bacterium]
MTTPRTTVAVVGGGVAGIVAAHELAKSGHDVTLLEKNGYVGGHTNTVVLDSGPDAGTAVDTGFIVCNDRTYPNFHRFLADLGVPWRWSDMSFGYHDANTGLQYSGGSLSGLFARRANLLSPSFLSFLADVIRFGGRAEAELERGGLAGKTLGDFLSGAGCSRALRDHYVAPIGAAIWSAGLGEMMEFPAETFVRFFKNHGLLSLTDPIRWQTVVGGSHAYVKSFLARFPGTVLKNAPIESISRSDAGVVVRAAGREPRRFDRVVIAAHADEALKVLADPSPEEKRLLGAWSYARNRTLLHVDEFFLPPNPRAWASWNYRRERGESGTASVSVTYDMNRLQGLATKRRYLVSLNPRVEPASGSVVREFLYTHPVYSFASIRSQPELRSLNGTRATWFCGSYFGYGFHEDAVASAFSVARDMSAVRQEVA